MNRRDLLLKEMGITQWQLHRPEALKGAVNIVVDESIRLVIIAEQSLNTKDPFVQDVLRSAEIKPQNCLFINFQQAPHLLVQHPVNYWLLSQEQEKLDQIQTLCTLKNSLWQCADLERLKQDSQAKRVLWKQIQTALI
ncbi:DNA polymerase III subunit psi [Mannheimia massilioguelmaensis]|uniref:DNA polymerase III subunit psi n=1 Tax=Mannheimia massilioguelmaensis TaxID=1604354 RepID=UPI0005C9A408|nr:DNA polymerase III subunit psi [Mannheimia massilioguelmaensis]